jgi:hypothetical protein
MGIEQIFFHCPKALSELQHQYGPVYPGKLYR